VPLNYGVLAALCLARQPPAKGGLAQIGLLLPPLSRTDTALYASCRCAALFSLSAASSIHRDLYPLIRRKCFAALPHLRQAAYYAPNREIAEMIAAETLKAHQRRLCRIFDLRPSTLKSFQDDWEASVPYMRRPKIHHTCDPGRFPFCRTSRT